MSAGRAPVFAAVTKAWWMKTLSEPNLPESRAESRHPSPSDRWSRRGVIAAGAALAGTGAWAADDPLAGLLSDGPDGLISAGLVARQGDGKIALAQASGRRLVPGSGGAKTASFTLDSPFRVASVSKMVVATAYMRMADGGLVNPDDDISRQLGFVLRHPAFPTKPILGRHLLSHTSGLRNGPSYPVPAGHALQEAFQSGGKYWDNGAWFGPADKGGPGGWFAYADVNYALLAQMMERATNQRFDRVMNQMITAHLDMDAGYAWSGMAQSTRDLAAPGARWIDGRWQAQVDDPVPAAPALTIPQPKDGPTIADSDLPLGVNGFHFAPQGGLRLSLRNMDRLAQTYRGGGQLYGERVISAANLESMQTPVWRYDAAHPNGETGDAGKGAGPFQGYGLGVMVPQGAPGPTGDAFFGSGSEDWRGHLGDAYGWMTGLFWNRKDGRTLVWAINGMRETGRAPGRRCALTPQEEAIIDVGLRAFAGQA
jgi:CubicO group peptidase (beta-lactamase class C family)